MDALLAYCTPTASFCFGWVSLKSLWKLFQFCFQRQLGKFWEDLPFLSLPLSSQQPLGSSFGSCQLSSTVRNMVCAWHWEGRVLQPPCYNRLENTITPPDIYAVLVSLPMKNWSVMMSKWWGGVLRGCGLEVLLLSTLNRLLNRITVDGFGFPSQGRQDLHHGSPIGVRQISQWRGK